MTSGFLIDENLSTRLVSELERRDLSATHVIETVGAGANDRTIEEYARRTDRVLVTNDDDFVGEGFRVQTILVSNNREPAHETAEKIAELVDLVPAIDELPRITWI